MKKLIKNLLFLLLVIFMLPSFVMAEKNESEITSTKKNIDKFVVDKVSILGTSCTRYADYGNTGKAALLFGGRVVNEYSKDANVTLELTLYDKDKKVLDIFNDVVSVTAHKYTNYRRLIYRNNVSYDLEKVVYYSLAAEIDSNLLLVGESEKDLFTYKNYKINIKVNKNNIYNVTESYDIEFKKHAVEIVHGIPYRLRYKLENGEKINKRTVMSNIKVKEDNHLKTEDGVRNIYIGKEDREVKTRSYSISYDYNAFKDIIDGQDEFVFYLVNNKDNKIDGLSFEIEFPTKLSNEKIIFMDEHGTVRDDVNYEVKYNKIIGKFDEMINSNISYAIKVVLKDRYFVKTQSNISNLTLLSLIVTIISLSIAIVVWLAQRKRDNNIKCNSIYFNEKLNSLEMGYLYSGEVKDKDIATLFMTLANKGYLKIDKTKNNYKIVKIKDYDQDDRLEKVFMNELFREQGIITRKGLINDVRYMKKNIEAKVQEHKKRNRIFIPSVINYKLVFWAMIVLIFVFNTLNIFTEYHTSAIVINVLLGSVGFIVLLYGILYEKIKIEKLLYLVVGLLLIISPIVLTRYQAFIQDSLKTITYIIGVLAILVIASMSKMMNNRTFYGNKMYRKVDAYKSYLNNLLDVDKELEKDELCFYKVLPYTFVLGISDKWYDKFTGKKIVPVKWYRTNEFNLETFYKDVKDVYADIFISLKNSKK